MDFEPQRRKLASLAKLLATEAYVAQVGRVDRYLEFKKLTAWEWFHEKQSLFTADSALEEAVKLKRTRRGTYTGEQHIMQDTQILNEGVVDEVMTAAVATETTAAQVIVDLAGFYRALRSHIAAISARPAIAETRATMTPAQAATYVTFATMLLCCVVELRLEAASHDETVDATLARRHDTFESWLVANADREFEAVEMYIRVTLLPAAQRALYQASIDAFNDTVSELSVRAALSDEPRMVTMLTQARRLNVGRVHAVRPRMVEELRAALAAIRGAPRDKLNVFWTTMLWNLATLWKVADAAGASDDDVLRREHKSTAQYLLAPSDVRFDIDLHVFERPMSRSRATMLADTVWLCVRAVQENMTPSQFLVDVTPFMFNDAYGGARRRRSRSRPRSKTRSRSRSKPKSRSRSNPRSRSRRT